MREYARIPADWVVPMPKGLDLFEAMALGTAGYTAALAVERMEHEGLKPANGPVIVTGATGGVGSIAIDILSACGYRVVALTGKEAENDYLKRIGADRSHAQEQPRSFQDQAARQGHLGRRGRQPWRRRAVVDCQHHAGRRYAGEHQVSLPAIPSTPR